MKGTRAGLLLRVAGGAGYLQLLAIAGITTVLVTRAFLAMAGYPQVGNGSLHIAHVLWGGLLMLAAILTALLFAGRAAHVLTALLGGVGLGLFVDEVGKFITRTNDYFYKPAAAIVYLVFAGLIVLTSLVRRPSPADDRGRVATAAQLATAGLIRGLTPQQRQAAEELLDGHDDEPARAVRQLLAAAPARPPSLIQAMLRRPATALRRLADHDRVMLVVIALFVVSRWIVAVIFDEQAVAIALTHQADPATEPGAILASAITRTVSAAFAIVGITRWRRDRRVAYRWFQAAALIGLLVTQLFNFTDSQFRAVAELPFDLLVLALLSYRLRQSRVWSTSSGPSRECEVDLDGFRAT
jgi:hypothetical protein